MPSWFKDLVQCHVQNGSTQMLWKDTWLAHSLELQLPRLFSYANNEFILVSQLLHLADLAKPCF
jgi:hypothetical protein